jgi:ATP-dependent Clp protease ATP-binding subunit ClpC
MEENSEALLDTAIQLLVNSQRLNAFVPSAIRSAVEEFAQRRQRFDKVGILSGKEPPPAPTAAPRPIPNLPARPAAKPAEPARKPTRPEPGPVEARPTPTLDKLGRDLTQQAREGKLAPVVGRRDEMQVMIETLCRTTKRNPLLVGPAGTGKTAIVEGLAQRVTSGDVPKVLKDTRIVEVQISSLLAGSDSVGSLEDKVGPLIEEASQPGVILFIDEIHTMVGAGAYRNNDNDLAQMLKPALARGDIACIGATTEGEYRHYIEKDAALERRFQPVRVHEPSAEETLHILGAVRDRLARIRGVRVSDLVLQRVVGLAKQLLPNRHFPDKAVDLVEQCVAHALLNDRTGVEPGDVEAVVRRMVGMPLGRLERLATLKERLTARALMSKPDGDALLSRLSVAVSGVDMNPERPNAVLLLTGDAEANAGELAETIADSLYGSAERVIRIDCGRFTDPGHLPLLIGEQSGAGSRPANLAPLQRLAQTPWCVLQLDNMHACHWVIRDVIRHAIAAGHLTDGRGKEIYLSDTVVVMTAQAEFSRVGGFRLQTFAEGGADASRSAAEQALGEDLLAEVDLVCTELPEQGSAERRWIEEELLAQLHRRYEEQGVLVSWDAGLVEWLLSQQASARSRRGGKRLIDEQVSPLLVPHLGQAGTVRLRITVGADGDVGVSALDPAAKKMRYKVGDTVEYTDNLGQRTHAVVEAKRRNVKLGKAGFEGFEVGTGDPVVGYNDQIVNVVPAGAVGAEVPDEGNAERA